MEPSKKELSKEEIKQLREIQRKRNIAIMREHANDPKPRKIGRNEKCPCGSGKKYKYCCMNKDKGYL